MIEYVELRDAWVKYKLEQLRNHTKKRWKQSVLVKLAEESRFSTWSERYTAACLYAWLLQLRSRDELDEEVETDELILRAVRHLEYAMSCAPSWYVASRRDWVLSEDPDLCALRQKEKFKQFEATYFPSASQTPERLAGSRRWEQSRYSVDLLAETARRWERVWLRRRDELLGAIDPDVVLDWFADETEAWRLVKSMAEDYCYWRVRNQLIAHVARCRAKYGLEPLAVGTPRFESWRNASQQSVEGEIRGNATRLKHLSEEIEGPRVELGSWRHHAVRLASVTPRSACSASSWIAPLVASALPAAIPGRPVRSVKRPPASTTISSSGA